MVAVAAIWLMALPWNFDRSALRENSRAAASLSALGWPHTLSSVRAGAVHNFGVFFFRSCLCPGGGEVVVVEVGSRRLVHSLDVLLRVTPAALRASVITQNKARHRRVLNTLPRKEH